ncbi:hypothetical protein DU68_11100 [Methanosarcina mazei]|uniref:Uncharacterized protein n=1 Tax=Methanosarcina mazei TaxID=2209 RepID=A0A0F8HRE5_METMZ|nr:hypothetical protein DU33_04780 [Methanosarcina mazei]KKG60153.1 hypothetical protein DU45_13650 [Methanosarcina mazei]KKG66619.1 hypothetical protein DU64_14660 [Methanosarcina mazei]KKG95587.1 hypothetical protein DU66_09950 [Methanosarcina mazei]KKH01412.1 hypothetical protein DU56_10495 [Methanosarcina mazei]
MATFLYTDIMFHVYILFLLFWFQLGPNLNLSEKWLPAVTPTISSMAILQKHSILFDTFNRYIFILSPEILT